MAFDLGRLLTVLSTHEVDYIVVGGVAAVLRGAPITTQDVDILYKIDEANILKLKQALDVLEAVVRGDAQRLPFGLSHLRTTGHKLAITNAGPLDILGSINNHVSYEDLLPYTGELEVVGVRIRVVTLAHLLELKRELGRPKDLAALPVLEATLREQAKKWAHHAFMRQYSSTWNSTAPQGRAQGGWATLRSGCHGTETHPPL